jgi:hypothetical protein
LSIEVFRKIKRLTYCNELDLVCEALSRMDHMTHGSIVSLAAAPRSTTVLTAIAVTLAALVVLVATSADTGMVWDEAATVRRERVLQKWFADVFHPHAGSTRWAAFSEQDLERSWPFSREEPDGHPPFYALVGLVGWWLTHNLLHPLTAYRFGPMALYAATAGVLYHHVARRRGGLAGSTTAALFLLMPRMFAHGHYAHYDMPMTCMWLLAQVAFINSLRSPGWIVPFGIALGLAAGSKFTGCFAVVAPMAWVAWAEGRAVMRRVRRASEGEQATPLKGARALAWALPVAALTIVAIQPPWWFHPIRGVERFLRSNLTRARTIPIPTFYLDRVYQFSLPWHNTLVLTGVTTPVAVQLLALLGLAACWARRGRDPGALVWPLSWAVLMIVRALPAAPGHDVVRLFLPSIASLAVLAGYGVAWLSESLRPRRLGWVATLTAVLAVGESLAGLVQTYSYTDSYYNVATGGLPGAERRGFELTYYFETIAGPEFLGWVRGEARRHPLELLFGAPLATLPLLREWGDLPRSVTIVTPKDKSVPDPARSSYYVMQRRRGVYLPHDWWLEQHGRPRFSVHRQGVDLLRIYDSMDLDDAVRATKDVAISDYIKNSLTTERPPGRPPNRARPPGGPA